MNTFSIAIISSLGTIGFLVVTYSLVSVMFYYYPPFKAKNCRKINFKKKVYAISHRGGASENIENTIRAFDHSVSLNIDMLELDCHLTKDGHVVVSHDNDLFRMTGIQKKITETNYHELPTLSNDLIKERSVIGSIVRTVSTSLITNEYVKDHYDVNNNKNNKDSTQIPLLEAVFAKYPNVPINLDIKMNDDELIQKVHSLIMKYNREDLIIWGSFNDDVRKKCFNLNPNIPIYFSKNGILKLLIGTMTGILPFMPLNCGYFEIVLPNFLLRKYGSALPLWMRIVLGLIKLLFIRKSFVRHLQKRGVSVILWVLDTEDEFEFALSLGVDGIMTDCPTKLSNYLKVNHK